MSRTAFLGSPESAVPTLLSLSGGSDVRMVLTRPDKVRGRGRTASPTPVKQVALDLGLHVAEPASRSELAGLLGGLELDLAVVAAFGMIVPAEVLTIPRRGMVNLHFSLLPRWRGAAPVERALLAGDQVTGITLMQMDEGLDTGPVLATWPTAIEGGESGGRLTARLAAAAGELLARELTALLEGGHHPHPQAEEQATYATMLSKAEAVLDPLEPADQLAAKIRAFDPRPGARFGRDGQPFKVFEPRVIEDARPAPGRLTLADGRLVVGTGTSGLLLGEVQPAGRRRMSGAEWARGVRGELGGLT